MTVRARGVAGGEHINLLIAEIVVAEWTLTTSFDDYVYTGNDAGDVQVEFDNDAEGLDVEVDYIIVNGETRQAEDMEHNTAAWDGECGGGSFSEIMNCNGVIGFGSTSDCLSGSCSGGGSSSSSSSSGGNGLASHVSFPVGAAVPGPGEGRSVLSFPEMQSLVREEFSQITAENIMKMNFLHPSEDTYTFDDADLLVNWANNNGIGVHGHTFIWHHEHQLPSWMNNYSGDFQTMLNEHVTTIADHFEGRVESWDVVNEVIDENSGNCWRDSLFYQQLGADFVANAFRAADAADPAADLYYNDYDTEGGNANKLQCLLQLVDSLQDQGVPIDGVGFQMHIQIDWPTTTAMASAFQAIVDRGLKVKITELEVPVNNPWSSNPFPQFTSFTTEASELQKARYKSIVETYLNTVPENLRGGVSVWGLWDGDSWILQLNEREGTDDWPLLFTGPANGPYEQKDAYFGVLEAFTGQ